MAYHLQLHLSALLLLLLTARSHRQPRRRVVPLEATHSSWRQLRVLGSTLDWLTMEKFSQSAETRWWSVVIGSIEVATLAKVFNERRIERRGRL